MRIEHHPDMAFLTAYAAGTLNLGRHIAVATHLESCPSCRQDVHLLAGVGGTLLADLPPAAMAGGAFQHLSARLDEPLPPPPVPKPEAWRENGVPGFVRRYKTKPWKLVAPGLAMRPILLPEDSDSRVFLLKSAPKAKLRHHTHSGTELTCVLRGGFTHEGGHFGPGDFDLGDENVHHTPSVDAGEPCLCLVAMDGRLKLKGLLGALFNPFIRL